MKRLLSSDHFSADLILVALVAVKTVATKRRTGLLADRWKAGFANVVRPLEQWEDPSTSF